MQHMARLLYRCPYKQHARLLYRCPYKQHARLLYRCPYKPHVVELSLNVPLQTTCGGTLTHCALRGRGGVLQMIATRDIAVGEEVVNNYGELSQVMEGV